ncbi:hypothetical protein [Dactylosporangium sp. NPDC005555]|uniref:alpha/beta hydrolase family protein n=1 Tax=Dactylosporangium sp. NPDC005555 TaxID=3154889 RepID=UPI0033BB1B94
MRRIITALLIAAAVTAGLPAAPALAAPSGFTATEVTFTGNGGVTLHGTVLAPAPAPAAGPAPMRLPGIVMLEGAGNRGRGYLRGEAEAYARHGVATLTYDKRTDGYSMLHRDFSVLADDALAGLRLLRDRPDVDPSRLGLWGLPEGAWVAPIAANRSADVAFLITVGAVGTNPVDQTAWAYGQYLRHAGVRGYLPRLMQTSVVRATIDFGLFAEAGFDPVPEWERVRQPVLAQWGELDRDAVPLRSSRLIGDALDRGGNARHTVRVVAGTNHNLHRTADDGFDRLPALPDDYADFETAWIADPSMTAPAVALRPSSLVDSAPGWGDTTWVRLGVLLLLVGTLVRCRVRWLLVLAPVTIAGTLVFMFFLLATAGKVVGPVLLGRPPAWLALQLLAVAVVAGFAWRRRWLPGALFLVWAIQWGLLIP